MADVSKAFNFVMSNECKILPDGSFSDSTITDIDGGKTRFGIDSKSNPDAVHDGFYDMPAPAALLYAQNFFKYDIFNQILGYNIFDQSIASKFADMAFNEGIEQATKIVQRAVNSLRDTPNLVVVDGKPGARTAASINAVEEDDLLKAIIEYGTQFYTGLRQTHPEKYSDAIYQAWIKRLEKIPPA